MPRVADGTGQFILHGEALPADAMAVRFEALERISHPYEVSVDFRSEDPSFDVASLLRTQVTLEVIDARGERRLFDGVVDRAAFLDVVASRLFFRVRLRPALSALAHRQDCRIYQEKTIPQVLQSVFEDAGFGDRVEWLNTKAYEPREFIVQYRESTLDFVHRLMEQFGLFYFFSHSLEGHTLCVGDDATVFSSRDDTPETRFSMTQGVEMGAEPLEDFRRRRSLRTADVEMTDYDFEKPQSPPKASFPLEEAMPASHYHYPGGFTKAAEGDVLAHARMRALRADADVVEGSSKSIGLRCGVPFSVAGAAAPDANGTFVVTELRTKGQQHASEGTFACENVFRGIPEGALYARPQLTRKPRIVGVQTVIVTGSSTQAQALHVDEHARIKVRFPWDRVGQQDHTASCWIRVSQPGLGGSQIMPRIGWEMAVAFLDGDPDRPLALGRIYTGEKVPPAGLPGSKTSGSLKSWSSPGGGGFNEISMADSADSQGFNVHAQKDLNTSIGNDKTEEVGVDETHHVSVNCTSSVGADEAISVGADQTVDIGENRTLNVGGSQSITVGANDTSNATCDFTEKIDVDRSYTVAGNQITIQNGIRYQVEGDVSRSVGGLQLNGSIASLSDKVAGNYSHTAGAVVVHVINGSHGENIAGNKTQTSTAAELHLTKANLAQTCGASVTTMVGGLHYQKLDGDLVIKAPLVTMLGAVGSLKGGGSEIKLGGGPMVVKGKKIAVKGAMVIKMGGQLKMA